MLDNYQIIEENGIPRFAVLNWSDFQKIKELLNSKEKLEDYLDYLHIQTIKNKNEKKYSLDEVKKKLDIAD